MGNGAAALGVLSTTKTLGIATIIAVCLAAYLSRGAGGNPGTSGSLGESALDADLLEELAKSGVKYNPDDIVAVAKTKDGKLVWLENGTKDAGLNHIIAEHAKDFLNKGIIQEQIPDYIMNALKNGEIIGYQGNGTGRLIYEFMFNGEVRRIAITIGNNGFIVGANPR